MEGQQRANAAQLAARNIKAAKGSRRKTPLKPNGAVQQSMPFGGDGGGGLFGGGVQATGTFNFSAPGGGGLSFPPSPFGNGNMIPGGGVSSPDTSENESDPRADTTGEEAARRKKDFRVGNDQGSQPASFHTPNAFGGNQPANPLSQAGSQGSQTGNIFSFQPSMSQPPASPAFNFGSTSTQEKPASNPFTFGASQPAPSSPATGFGAGSTQDKPGNNIFGSFGQQQPAQPAPSSIFNFGSPATKDKPAVPSTPFTFGQSSTQPSSSGISFGATPAAEKPTTSIFGTPQPTPSANPFGSLSQPASPSMSFGSTQAAEKPTTNIFGNPQPQPTPTNIFGSLGQQSTPSNMFANPTTSAPPASNVFGQLEQQPAPNSSSLFGGQGQQQNANILFGNSNQAPATPSAAEEPKSQPTPSSNIFGNLNNPPPSSTSLFSSPNKQSAPASTLFGGSNIQTTSTGDLFGHLNKPVDQKLDQPKVNGNSLNGTSSKTDSLPSTSNTIGSSLFSQAPSSNLFGQSKQSVSIFLYCAPRMEILTLRSFLHPALLSQIPTKHPRPLRLHLVQRKLLSPPQLTPLRRTSTIPHLRLSRLIHLNLLHKHLLAGCFQLHPSQHRSSRSRTAPRFSRHYPLRPHLPMVFPMVILPKWLTGISYMKTWQLQHESLTSSCNRLYPLDSMRSRGRSSTLPTACVLSTRLCKAFSHHWIWVLK